MCKLYQSLLKVTMIFLALTNPKVGPRILRVILALVKEEGVDINRAVTQYDDVSDGYGIAVDPELT